MSASEWLAHDRDTRRLDSFWILTMSSDLRSSLCTLETAFASLTPRTILSQEARLERGRSAVVLATL
jgi:hypothetical protein